MDYARQRLLQARRAGGHLRRHGPARRGRRRACGASSSARRPATWRASSPPLARVAVPRWPCATTAPSRGATCASRCLGLRRRSSRRSSSLQGQVLAFDVDRGLACGRLRHARRDARRATSIAPTDRHRRRSTRRSAPSATARAALEELFVRSNRATLLWIAARVRRASCSSPATSSTFVLGDAWDPRRRADPGPRGRRRAGAARLQLVLVLSRRTAHPAAGASRPSVARGGLLRARRPGARRRRGRPASSSGAAPRSLVAARRARALRPRAAARRAGARPARRARPCRRAGAAAAALALRARPVGLRRGRRPRRSPSSRSSRAVVVGATPAPRARPRSPS